MIFEQLMGVK